MNQEPENNVPAAPAEPMKHTNNELRALAAIVRQGMATLARNAEGAVCKNELLNYVAARMQGDRGGALEAIAWLQDEANNSPTHEIRLPGKEPYFRSMEQLIDCGPDQVTEFGNAKASQLQYWAGLASAQAEEMIARIRATNP